MYSDTETCNSSLVPSSQSLFKQTNAFFETKLEPLRGTYRGPVGLGIPLLFKYFAPVPPGSVEANVDLFYNQRQFVHLLRCK